MVVVSSEFFGCFRRYVVDHYDRSVEPVPSIYTVKSLFSANNTIPIDTT